MNVKNLLLVGLTVAFSTSLLGWCFGLSKTKQKVAVLQSEADSLKEVSRRSLEFSDSLSLEYEGLKRRSDSLEVLSKVREATLRQKSRKAAVDADRAENRADSIFTQLKAMLPDSLKRQVESGQKEQLEVVRLLKLQISNLNEIVGMEKSKNSLMKNRVFVLESEVDSLRSSRATLLAALKRSERQVGILNKQLHLGFLKRFQVDLSKYVVGAALGGVLVCAKAC